MQSFDFQLVVQCPLPVVFAIYQDVHRWRYRSIFGDIQWVRGEPWQEGSRLLVEVHVPVRGTVDQVVQRFKQNESVTYLSHVFGITCETHVHFKAASVSQTEIRVAMQMVGIVSRSLGFAIEPMMAKTTRSFFEDLRRECELAVKAGDESSSPPGGQSSPPG